MESKASSGLEGLCPAEAFRKAAKEILESHECHHLMPVSGKVVVFDSLLKIKDAFLGLVEHDIKCAPLWNSVLGEYMGMITVTDFIDILVFAHSASSNSTFVDDFGEKTCAQWNYIKQRRMKRSKGDDGRLVDEDDLSQELNANHDFKSNEMLLKQPSDIFSIGSEESIIKGIQLLHQYKVHRLPIVQKEPETNILCIVNHQRILRFLMSKMKGSFSHILVSASIEDLEIGTFGSDCITISPKTKIFDTLMLLKRYNVPAIPIVDENRRYVDAYSRSDVRYLAMDKMYDKLSELSVEDALSNYHSSRVIPTCLLTEKIETVFQRLLNTRKHACVVVDTDNVVQGIVSLSEIFSRFC